MSCTMETPGIVCPVCGTVPEHRQCPKVNNWQGGYQVFLYCVRCRKTVKLCHFNPLYPERDIVGERLLEMSCVPDMVEGAEKLNDVCCRKQGECGGVGC